MTIKIRRAHQLEVGRLYSAANELADKLTEKLGGSYAWRNNQLLYRRSGAKARITCAPEDVVVEVKLGFMLLPLSGSIEAEIKQALDNYLGAQAL